MSGERKSKAKKGKEKEVEEEQTEKPKKVKKEKETEEEQTEKPKKKGKKEQEKAEKKEPEIDTVGKEVKFPPGGKYLFQCFEIKDVTKKPFSMIVHVDVDEREVYKSKPTKGDKFQFDARPEFFPSQDEDKFIIVTLYEKSLVVTKFRGEVRIPVETLLSCYPYDQWFELTNKEGKEDGKVSGFIKLRFLYTPKDKEPRHDEFKYPLHSLIHQNRLDLFSTKLRELKEQEKEAQGDASAPSFLAKEDDKKLTPLLLAASLGHAGFFKLLVEAGANLDETDSDGRNSCHLAALNGHVKIIEYLAYLGKTQLLQAPEKKDKKTPLHIAAQANQAGAVTALITAGVNIDARDKIDDTPLTSALVVETGAAAAITALVKGGADLYAKNNKHSVPAWEMANDKEICNATTSRAAFMKACDVIDPREFEIEQKFPKKKRIEGKNLSKKWDTATQFILTAQDPTKVSLLVYSKTRTDDSSKQVAFCVVKNDRNEREHKMPSFQQEGMGFGSTKPFEFIIEPELSYNVITYCTKDELAGDFLLCIFSGEDSSEVECVEAIDWPYVVTVKSAWKGDTAAGSGEGYRDNPSFKLTPSKKSEVLVMLRQLAKDVGGLAFTEESQHRIVPSKFYVGFYVLIDDEQVNKTENWVNSFDVYKFLKLEGGTTYTIYPCARKEGQELEFEISAYSVNKIKLVAA